MPGRVSGSQGGRERMHETLSDLLARQVAERPDALAFIDGSRMVRVAEFEAMVQRTAAWLDAHGIGAGDRVAVWLVNRIEWLALLFGLARVGAALVAVNTRYRAAELEYLLERSGARMLVLQPGVRSIDFAAVLDQTDSAALRAVEQIAVVGAPQTLRMLDREPIVFDALLGPDAGGSTPDRCNPDALAVLYTTSGTTKGPKLVMHTQRTLALHAQHAACGVGFDADAARLLAALPLCGTFGLTAALAAMAAAAPIVLMDVFDGPTAAALVRQHAVTHVFGSDEMFRRMAEAVVGDAPFPSARLFGYAAFQPGAAEFAQQAWARGMPLTGLYGSSEVQALFAVQSHALPLAQRVEGGGLPCAVLAGGTAQVRIRDVETGALAAPGTSGEIEIRAPASFVGYLNDLEATARAIDAEGFFRTGDLGHLRADGSFVYETRMGDAIRLGGFLVNPGEIEEELKRLPQVADAQVVAVEIGGATRSVAFIIPAIGSASLEEASLLQAARARLAGYKVPARVYFVDQFPVTQSSNGTKIQRAKLRQMATELLSAHE